MPNSNGTALIFLIDQKYMRPFEVFYHSLHETGSLQGVPIIVLTTDKSLLDDKLLNRICYDVVLIDEAEAQRYRVIKAGKVPDYRGHKALPAYYFFKFHVFAEERFDQLIYFDADLLCLNNIDHILTDRGDNDMAGSLSFGKNKVKHADGAVKPLDDSKAAVDQFLFTEHHAGARPGRTTGLNSGVMVLGKSIRSPAIRDELLAMAAKEEFSGDQNVICAYLHKHREVGFKFLPTSLNVPRRTFSHTSVEHFFQRRKDIGIFHFNVVYPWDRGHLTHFVEYLWWDAYARSRPFIEALRG